MKFMWLRGITAVSVAASGCSGDADPVGQGIQVEHQAEATPDDASPPAEQPVVVTDLEGTWELVERFKGQSRTNFGLGERYVFAGDLLTRHRGPGRAVGSKQARLVVDPAQVPKSIDLTPTAGTDAGQSIQGIYEVEGDVLRMVWAFSASTDEPASRPATFDPGSGSQGVLEVLVRVPENSTLPTGGTARLHLLQRPAKTEQERAFQARLAMEMAEAAEDSADVARRVIPILHGFLKGDALELRAIAVAALGDIGDAKGYRTPDGAGTNHPLSGFPETLDALAAVAADQTPGQTRRPLREMAPRAMGKVVETNIAAAERLVPAATRLLDHDDPDVRGTAAEALAQMAERMKPLAASGQSPLWGERIKPLFLAATPRLQELADDENEPGREDAERAVKAIRELP